MPAIERALVVGAGIGGLAAFTALAQQGIEADVVEIDPEVNVYGVGIVQPANSLRLLRRLGVLEEVLDTGYAFDHWLFFDHAGRLIVDVPSRLGGDVPACCGLLRPELHRILIGAATREGASIRYGTSIAQLEDLGDAVAVEFTDGSNATYDLVVAFDGIRSTMRRRLFGDGHEPIYTGSAVWRVSAPRAPEVTCGGLYQSPWRKAGRTPLGTDMMYLLLVSREPPGVRYERSQFPALLSVRLAEFGGDIAEIRDQIGDEDEIVFSPLSEVLLPTPWHRGRIVLGGDAAHACVPHLNQGAAMAVEDAVVLAEELARWDTAEAALNAYSQRRWPRVRFAQEASRAVLDAESHISEETLDDALAQMAVHLPAQAGAVDDFLNQPA
jgi:2-polyprenyl-6-methoxyphenol hydroxylase-like FAD-dependent oxidoreductase